MATAGELLREAQYALGNVSGSSTDSSKFESQAKKLARRVIRQYPASIEAGQARAILEQLGVLKAQPVRGVETPTTVLADFAAAHAPASGHTTTPGRPPPDLNMPPDAKFENSPLAKALERDPRLSKLARNSEWRDLLMRFVRVPSGRKNLLAIAAIVLFFIPGGILLAFGLIVFYATRPAVFKRHLDRLLTALGSP